MSLDTSNEKLIEGTIVADMVVHYIYIYIYILFTRSPPIGRSSMWKRKKKPN
jgi:hypothetical protein